MQKATILRINLIKCNFIYYTILISYKSRKISFSRIQNAISNYVKNFLFPINYSFHPIKYPTTTIAPRILVLAKHFCSLSTYIHTHTHKAPHHITNPIAFAPQQSSLQFPNCAYDPTQKHPERHHHSY